MITKLDFQTTFLLPNLDLNKLQFHSLQTASKAKQRLSASMISGVQQNMKMEDILFGIAML